MRSATCRTLGDLGELVREQKLKLASLANKPVAPTTKLPDHLSDEELFELSMRDVSPLGWSAVPLPPSEPLEILNPQQTEDQGLRLLTEFVAGKGEVDLRVSGEYVEGAPHPRGHLFLETLRKGCFSVQAHLDLHGFTIDEARQSLETFLRHSLHLGYGCVRIIHGRGQHSLEGQPVLKEQVQKWLSSRRMSRHVVAFTSAQLCDGGGGALYVLLRKTVRPKSL